MDELGFITGFSQSAKWKDLLMHLVTCPDLEPLLDQLAERLRIPLKDPFAEEIILVPFADMARFLRRGLAPRLGEQGLNNGILANVRFIYPRELVNATLDDPLGVKDSPWDATRLTWRISSRLEQFQHIQLPRAFSESPLAASRRVADLFDRYASHRPEMLQNWRSGKPQHAASNDRHSWQFDLFRHIDSTVATEKRSARAIDSLDEYSKILESAELPERITAFGVDSLSRAALQVLERVSESTDLVVYWTFPISSKTPKKIPVQPRRIDQTVSEVVHPVTSRWAAHAIESLSLVDQPTTTLPPVRRGTTLLHLVQQGVLNDSPPRAQAFTEEQLSEILKQGDGSIQIHAGYGIMRQVEALRDSLLHILNTNPDVQLRDILIVCGNVKEAAPVLNAVLNPANSIGENVPKMPINVVRGAALHQDEITEAFMTILDLISSRFSASAVLDAAALAPIRRKFSFDDEALSLLDTWTEQLGVRYGLTPESREPIVGSSSIFTGTWAAAIDRLMVGIAVPGETVVKGPGDVVPYDGITSQDLPVAGAVVEFLSRLKEAARRFKVDVPGGQVTLEEWRDGLLVILDEFIEPLRQDEERMIRIRTSIHRMYQESSRHPELSNLSFGLRDLQAISDEYLQSGSSDYWTNYEAITVTSLGGEDHIPFKVIAVVEADEKVFAGSRTDGDDILADDPLVGEPIYTVRARQQLLNLLMAARNNFILTCSGSDIRSNKSIPLAVPVQELLELTAQTIAERSSDLDFHRTLASHARHNFSESSFEIGRVLKNVPFTFDVNSLTAYEMTTSLKTKVSEENADEMAEQATVQSVNEPLLPTEMAQVHKMLRDPIKFYYEDVLNVDIPELYNRDLKSTDRTISGEAVLPLTLNALEVSGLGRSLLQHVLKSPADKSKLAEITREVSEWAKVQPLTNSLPPGELGQMVVNEVKSDVIAMIEKMLDSESVPSIAGEDVDCTYVSGGHSTQLRVENVVAEDHKFSIVRLIYKRPAPPMLLELWADISLLTLHHKGSIEVIGQLVTRPDEDGKGKPPTHTQLSLRGEDADARVATAQRVMDVITFLYAEAHDRPIPLFATASVAVAGGETDQLDSKTMKAAQLAFNKDLSRSPEAQWFVGDRDLSDLLAADSDESEAEDPRLSEIQHWAGEIWRLFSSTTQLTGWGPKQLKEDGEEDEDTNNE